MEAGREFRFIEDTGTNDWRMKWSSTLTVKEWWESGKRVLRAMDALGELLILTHQITCRDSIYKIGKARKHFFD